MKLHSGPVPEAQQSQPKESSGVKKGGVYRDYRVEIGAVWG